MLAGDLRGAVARQVVIIKGEHEEEPAEFARVSVIKRDCRWINSEFAKEKLPESAGVEGFWGAAVACEVWEKSVAGERVGK
jgi:hypothetical protein